MGYFIAVFFLNMGKLSAGNYYGRFGYGLQVAKGPASLKITPSIVVVL